MSDAPGALAGVRVVDFGRYVAGPWCAQLLQSMGAEVVRVERPGGAEDRAIFPFGDDSGGYMVNVNRGKRSLALKPTTPEGRAVVARLVQWADVVVANLPDDTLASLGLDWDTVHALNPRAVLATASTYGNEGPYAGRLGFDGIGQVMSGASYLGGTPGSPVKAFVPWVDYGSAANLAFGVVSALLQRERTGAGTRVETSLVATGLSMMGHMLAEQSVLHPDRPPAGNRHPAAGPSDLAPTSDGHVMVQVIGDAMFRRWAEAMGRPDLVDDPRFADDELRGVNGAVLSEVLAGWTRTRTTAQVLEELASLGVPSGPVLSPQQALDDPHISSVMLEAATATGVDGPVVVPRMPVVLHGSGAHVGVDSPTLGRETDDVLQSLGYGAEEIAALRASRTVA